MSDLKVSINADAQAAYVGERNVHLTGKEYAILELLFARKGEIVTRDLMLRHLYADCYEPEVKIIDVFICKLRRKLAEAGARNVIGSVWGRGYIVRGAA